MRTCNKHIHAVVVFLDPVGVETKCPLCEAETTIRVLEQENNDLQEYIDTLTVFDR